MGAFLLIGNGVEGVKDTQKHTVLWELVPQVPAMGQVPRYIILPLYFTKMSK